MFFLVSTVLKILVYSTLYTFFLRINLWDIVFLPICHGMIVASNVNFRAVVTTEWAVLCVLEWGLSPLLMAASRADSAVWALASPSVTVL